MGQAVRQEKIHDFWVAVDQSDLEAYCDWIDRLLRLLTDDQMNDVLKIADGSNPDETC